jgi:hypothetical protein
MMPLVESVVQNAEAAMDLKVASFSMTRIHFADEMLADRMSFRMGMSNPSLSDEASMVEPSRRQKLTAPAMRPLAAAITCNAERVTPKV